MNAMLIGLTGTVAFIDIIIARETQNFWTAYSLLLNGFSNKIFMIKHQMYVSINKCSFLGLVNHQCSFLPKLHHTCTPLNNLLKIFLISRITSEETTLKLQHIFNRFAVSETRVSDNGTGFTSVKFSNFCQQNGIKQICIPPFHLQSNEQIEWFVDTFKRALQKLKGGSIVTEILETFLTSFWVTLNTNIPKITSRSKVLITCKIWLYVDIIRPSKQNFPKRNTAIEHWFNCHHSSESHTFKCGPQFLARDYQNDMEKWTQYYILCQTGKITYDVSVQSSTWVQHANQQCTSKLEIPTN